MAGAAAGRRKLKIPRVFAEALPEGEPALRITPLDIRNHEFQRRISGYDREEVDSFLRMVAEDYEAALRLVEGLRGRVRDLEARVAELTASEQLLQQTLTTAQQLSDDLKNTAMREAEIMVSEAEIKGEGELRDAATQRPGEVRLTDTRIRLAERITGPLINPVDLLQRKANEKPIVIFTPAPMPREFPVGPDGPSGPRRLTTTVQPTPVL